MEGRDVTPQREQWDKTYSNKEDHFGKEPSQLVKDAVNLFRERGVKTVLELGCGQGRDTWYLLKNGFEVSALDYSEIGVAQMRECAEITGVKVVLMALDARQGLPFSDASFDAVYSHMFFTMEFTESEVATLMAECYRVLRPGGLNVYSVRNFNDQHYGKFMPAGEDMWRNPLGFVVHFYSMQAIRRLSRGYEILHINEFEDGSPPSVKKLYEVVLERHSGER